MCKVYISDCDKYDIDKIQVAVDEAITALGGWEKYIKKGQKVLLKVNLIGPKKPEKAATTHPEFVRAIGRRVKSLGASVYIGDSAGGAIAGMAPTAQALEVCGMTKVAAEEGFTVVNFDEIGPSNKDVEGNYSKDLYLTNALDEVDVVINLPKMKTHSMGIYTGAVKNLFGAIPGLRKAMYHKNGPAPILFGEFLADIHCSITNMPLHIMDGIVSMQGEGPTAGKTYQANKIIVSEDPLALDRVAIEMMGIDPSQVEILAASARRGIGKFKLEDIDVLGSFARLESYDLPKRYNKNKKRNYDRVKGVINFFETVPQIDYSKCIHCDMCIQSCPVDAIDKKTMTIDYEKCISCLCCHELCMTEAVALINTHAMANVVKKISSVFYR